MNRRDQVQAVVDGILSGEILETFERWYADEVVMSENGVDERVGKDANREYERAFVEGVTFHGAEVHAMLVDGDEAAVEWTLDFTPKGGERVQQRQIARQTWRGDAIVRETFYHA